MGKTSLNHGLDTNTETKVKKRAWRDKVRKKARKLALQAERGATTSEEVKIQLAISGEEPKKKKRIKKKKYRENTNEVATVAEEIDPKKEKLKQLEAGRFRFINEQLYTMSGGDALKYFTEDPDAFHCYHKGFADQVKKWPNHPLETIVRWLKAKPVGKVVFDLGCGEAKIAEAVSNIHEVKSFDLVAVNERVTACDMAHLPAEKESADIVIFCLSLMGTNVQDFIKEARRVLKTGGSLKIAEVTSRFVNMNMFCEAICKLGFQQKEKRQLTDYFVMLEFTKTSEVENKRPFGLKLKPCLYKKR